MRRQSAALKPKSRALRGHFETARVTSWVMVWASCVERPKSLLSHLRGPQPQWHLGIGWIVFPTAEEIGQGSALEQVQLHQA